MKGDCAFVLIAAKFYHSLSLLIVSFNSTYISSFFSLMIEMVDGNWISKAVSISADAFLLLNVQHELYLVRYMQRVPN